MIFGAAPVWPPEARSEGLGGDVRVRVSLNAASQITDVNLISAASGYFVGPALAAARASKFAAEIRDCVPVAGSYELILTFNPVRSLPPQISSYFIGTWRCTFGDGGQGVVAVGLNAGGAMVFAQSEVTKDRGIEYASGIYTETDHATNATDTSKSAAFRGVSPGWQGQTLIFEGSRSEPAAPAQVGAPAIKKIPEALTYVREDDTHFTRTIVVDGQTESSESCTRL